MGFQNHLKFGEQARVLRLIPGLENARSCATGKFTAIPISCADFVVRNAADEEPRFDIICRPDLRRGGIRRIHRHRIAGRDSGSGAGFGTESGAAAAPSAFGSLVHYITHADPKNFQPANITFDLLPALEHKIRDRQERHRQQCALALKEFDGWLEQLSPCGADTLVRRL